MRVEVYLEGQRAVFVMKPCIRVVATVWMATACLFACSKPAPPPAPPEAITPPPAVTPPPPPAEPAVAVEPPASEGTTDAAGTPAEASPPAAPPAPAPEPKAFFLENGMTYQAVKSMYGSPGQLVTGSAPEDSVMRWQLDGGASVQIRFRGGLVDRFTTYAPTQQDVDGATPEQQITRAQYDQISPGLTLYEVCESLDIEAKLMATGANGEKVYRWTDPSGASFGARFEGDKLVRKTALIEPLATAALEDGGEESPVLPEEDEITMLEGEEMEEGAYEAEGEDLPDEDPRPRAPAERTVYSSRAPAGESPGTSERGTGTGTGQVSRAEGRVRVIGKSAQAQEDAAAGAGEETYRQRRQRARLPEYRHSLRKGVYEIRVRNESGSKATIGLRQGKNGRDLSVGAGGSGSFHVDRGSYELFYILSGDPYQLERGGGVSVDGQFESDLEIVIEKDGASVNHLDTPVFY